MSAKKIKSAFYPGLNGSEVPPHLVAPLPPLPLLPGKSGQSNTPNKPCGPFVIDGIEYTVMNGAPYKKISGFWQKVSLEEAIEIRSKRSKTVHKNEDSDAGTERTTFFTPTVVDTVASAAVASTKQPAPSQNVGKKQTPLTTIEKAFIQEWKGKFSRIANGLKDETIITCLLTLVSDKSKVRRVKVMDGLLGDSSPSLRACSRALDGSKIPYLDLPPKVAGPLIGPIAKANAVKKIESENEDLKNDLKKTRLQLAQISQSLGTNVNKCNNLSKVLDDTESKLTDTYSDVVKTLAEYKQVMEFISSALSKAIDGIKPTMSHSEIVSSFSFVRRVISNEAARSEDLEAHARSYLKEHLTFFNNNGLDGVDSSPW